MSSARWARGTAAAILTVAVSLLPGLSPAKAAPRPPVLAYGFDVVRNGTVLDSSPSRLHGRLVPATDPPILAAGRPGHGRALELDGSAQQFVDVGDSPGLDVNAFTLAAWVRYLPNIHDRRWEVLEKGAAYWMNIATDTRTVRVGGFFGGCAHGPGSDVWRWVDSVDTVDPGVWTHLTGTYDGQRLRVYVNGALQRSITVSGATCANDNPLAVGAKNVATGSLNYFDGLLDDVRIYDRALTGAAISALMARPVS